MIVVPAFLLLFTACAREEESATAGIDPKADELMHEMSDLLAQTPRLYFAASEVRDVVGPTGTVRQISIGHKTYVERPNRLRREISVGDTVITAVVSQGSVGVHGARQKFYAQAQVPDTLDAALDFLAERLDIRMPIADLLYSSPYESYVDSNTVGRYMGTETIDGVSCHHLAFEHPGIDFEMWVEDGEQPLPCKLVLTYKLDDGAPKSVLFFSEWNLTPDFAPALFVYTPPEGYVRIAFLGLEPESDAAAPSTTGN
jgi:hypothetical protein